jgi:hypothetical protein
VITYPVSFKFYDIPESAEPGGARPGGRAGRLGLGPDRIAGGSAIQEEHAGKHGRPSEAAAYGAGGSELPPNAPVSSFLLHPLDYRIHVKVHGRKIAVFILFDDFKSILFIEAYCLSL